MTLEDFSSSLPASIGSSFTVPHGLYDWLTAEIELAEKRITGDNKGVERLHVVLSLAQATLKLTEPQLLLAEGIIFAICYNLKQMHGRNWIEKIQSIMS